MALAPLSAGFQSLPLLPTIKSGPSSADSQVGGLVHALGSCGSPLTSPVRLGVSPAAASTPTGVFNQRFEALFPRAGALLSNGLLHSRAVPPGLSMRKCGAAGSASCSLACPVPQSATSLGPPAAALL